MAFEQITKFTVLMDLQCKQLKQASDIESINGNRKKADEFYTQYWAYYYSLLNYYETVLQIPKFRYQREYCKRVLIDLEPAFCRGYFKKVKA